MAATALSLELPDVHRLVLWACPFGCATEWLEKKSSNDDPKLATSQQVLILHGDHDQIVKDDRYALWCSTPDKISLVQIKGGNHAGFGHYGPQNFPYADGERQISLDEQQAFVVTHTVKFLQPKRLGKKNS